MASSYSNRTRTSCDDALLFAAFKDLIDGLRSSKASNGSTEGGGSDEGSTRWKCRTALPRMLLTLDTLAVGRRNNFTFWVYTSHRRLVLVPCFVLSGVSASAAKRPFLGSSFLSEESPMSSANMRSEAGIFLTPKVGTSSKARKLAFSIRESMDMS